MALSWATWLHPKNGPHQLPCGLHGTNRPFTHCECRRPATPQVVGTRTCLAAPNSATHTHTQPVAQPSPRHLWRRGCTAPERPVKHPGAQQPEKAHKWPQGLAWSSRTARVQSPQAKPRRVQVCTDHPAPRLQRASRRAGNAPPGPPQPPSPKPGSACPCRGSREGKAGQRLVARDQGHAGRTFRQSLKKLFWKTSFVYSRSNFFP